MVDHLRPIYIYPPNNVHNCLSDICKPKNMETCVFLVPFLVFLLTTIYYYLISLGNKRNNNENQTKLKLPPGSMGWPYIGQTIQLYSQHPNNFFVGKQTRLINFHSHFCPSFFYFL